jgi:TetR/AcrR family transcriptional regulator, transcriptional repressor for nem operon
MRHANKTKSESHTRIIAEASRLMRERGTQGISVSDVMKASGLTHGGFYAHFDSKDALAAAAAAEGFREKISFLKSPAHEALELYVESFLSEGHLHNLGAGCPVVGFAVDALRSGGQYRDAVSDGLGQLIDAISDRLAGDGSAREEAIRLLAIMVGGIVMARVAQGEAQKLGILNAIRNSPSVAQAGH